MNKEELTLIRNAFHDNRKIIEETPDEVRRVEKGVYPGGSVYTTEDGEFIDLEIQTRDYDIEDHINYIEFAESLYEKNHRKVNLYIYCIPSVKVNIKLYEIRSEADFKINIAYYRPDTVIDKIKSKIRD